MGRRRLLGDDVVATMLELGAAADREQTHERYFGHEHVTVIEPACGWRPLDLRELWAYHELARSQRLLKRVRLGDPIALRGGLDGPLINPIFIDDLVDCVRAVVRYRGPGARARVGGWNR